MSKTNGMKFKTKMNIFFIALKLILCVAIMASSTYALFTDTSDAGVCVTAGEMDVKLLQWVPSEYVDISGEQGDVFGTRLWEPGQTRVVFLQVRNDSNIPIKYLLEMIATTNDLDGAFEYCAFEGKQFDTAGESWESITEGKKVYKLSNGINSVSGENYIYLDIDGEAYYTLAVHMLEGSSNVYQNKTADNEACNVNIHLFAVQGNADIDTQDTSN